MKQVRVYMKGIEAGVLIESDNRDKYVFEYLSNYSGEPVSLKMPVDGKKYSFPSFPPYFDGLLPEGFQLEGLLKKCKIDRSDYLSQLIAVGNDLVGAVTIKEM